MAADLLRREFADPAGRIFARFDEQDSGNVSFGVEAHGAHYFVKTAGAPDAIGLPLAHADRLALLGNTERLARSVSHSALTRFIRSCHCAWGRALVYGGRMANTCTRSANGATIPPRPGSASCTCPRANGGRWCRLYTKTPSRQQHGRRRLVRVDAASALRRSKVAKVSRSL